MKQDKALFDLVRLPELKKALDEDAKVLEVFQDNLVEHVREFCGSHYSDRPGDQAPDNPTNPVNLLALYVRIITDALVPSDPRFLASTFISKVRPYASIYESWGNRQLLRMGFADILRSAINDSIFLMAAVRIAITAPAESRFGYGKIAGDVTMDNIDFQNMIFDTGAKTFKHCGYIGHYYDVYLEDVAKSELYDRKAKLRVIPADDENVSEAGSELIHRIGVGSASNNERYYKKARLCEVWLRRENVVVTFDAEGSYDRPLLVQKWVGPKCGPYKFLSLGDVLGNLIPKGPICDLVDMHREFNLLWQKLSNQASRQKVVPVFKDAGDAKRWDDVADGQAMQCESPAPVTELKTGGPDQAVFQHAMASYNLFSEYAGNLKSLGGLASQSDTATQEKLVNASAGKLIQAMGGRVMSFVQDLVGMNGIGWFWWNSPNKEFKTSYQPPGVPDISIDRSVTPHDRFGIHAEEIDIQVDAYSFVRQTPQTRVQSMDALVQGVILKALPLFNQPGVGDMLATYIDLKAKYENNPDLIVLKEKLLGVEGPPVDQAQPPQQAQDSPAETVHTRVSRPGMTSEGNMQAIMQATAAGKMSIPGGGDQQMLGQMKAG